MVAGDPHQGGASWAVLQYVAGLRSLGHEVVLVEPVEAAKLDPAGGVGRYFRALPLLDGARGAAGAGQPRDARAALRRARALRLGSRPADQRLRDAARRAAARADPDPALPRPRPRLQPGLAGDAARRWASTSTPTASRSGRRGRPRGLPDPDLRPRVDPDAASGRARALARRAQPRPAATPSPASATGAATARSSTGASTTASAPTRCAS